MIELILSLLAFSGLGFGVLIAAMTGEETELGKKYLPWLRICCAAAASIFSVQISYAILIIPLAFVMVERLTHVQKEMFYYAFFAVLSVEVVSAAVYSIVFFFGLVTAAQHYDKGPFFKTAMGLCLSNIAYPVLVCLLFLTKTYLI